MAIDSHFKSGILFIAYKLVRDTLETKAYAGLSVEDRINYFAEHLPEAYNSLYKALEGKIK